MNLNALNLAHLDLTTWWMLGSAAAALAGFVGWQLVGLVLGARALVGRRQGEPKFDPLKETLLPGYLANRGFKRGVSAKVQQSRVGRWFFLLMLVGLAAHIGFWVYAANHLAS